jgi:hypothetical protein
MPAYLVLVALASLFHSELELKLQALSYFSLHSLSVCLGFSAILSPLS